jgi:hypothetical protein
MNFKITAVRIEPMAGVDRNKYFSNVQCFVNGLANGGEITAFLHGKHQTLNIAKAEIFCATAHFNNEAYFINAKECTPLPRRGSFKDLWFLLKKWWFFRQNTF